MGRRDEPIASSLSPPRKVEREEETGSEIKGAAESHTTNGHPHSTSPPAAAPTSTSVTMQLSASEQRPDEQPCPSSPVVYIKMGKGARGGGPGRMAEEGRRTVARSAVPGLFEQGERGNCRKWKRHNGRNRFLCDGRLVMARQGGVFLLTLMLILLTMALFCVFDLPYLTQKVSVAIPVVTALLFLSVLSSLFRTAFSDPGIVPRASPRECLELERQFQESDPFFNADEWSQPRTRIVNIRGQQVKLKYCFTCCIFRPPRSSHCSICDNCVLNFDHHCPWVGNCIGSGNYRHFYHFITSLSLLDGFMGFCVAGHLYQLTLDNGNFINAIRQSPASVLTGLINVISIWSVVGLSGFHTYLLALGQTTNEDIKGTFNRKLHPQVQNPYNTGNCIKNCLSVLCSSEKPSLLDARGWASPEEGTSVYVDASLLDQLAAKRRTQLDQKSLVAASTPRNRSAERKRRKVSGRRDESAGGDSNSCPASPARQRRHNKSDGSQRSSGHMVIIPAFGNGRKMPSSTHSLDPTGGQHRSRTVYGNNLVAPIDDFAGSRNMSEGGDKDERRSALERRSTDREDSVLDRG